MWYEKIVKNRMFEQLVGGAAVLRAVYLWWSYERLQDIM